MTDPNDITFSWRALTEHVEGTATHGMLVLPEGETAHRVYYVAPTLEHFAKLVAVPVAMALDTGAFELACKFVRDNPDTDDWRGPRLPAWAPPQRRFNISNAARMAIEGFKTAIAEGARSTDGSHVNRIAHAHIALAQHIERLERIAGRR